MSLMALRLLALLVFAACASQERADTEPTAPAPSEPAPTEPAPTEPAASRQSAASVYDLLERLAGRLPPAPTPWDAAVEIVRAERAWIADSFAYVLAIRLDGSLLVVREGGIAGIRQAFGPVSPDHPLVLCLLLYHSWKGKK
jgi:hypothetical protein